MGIDIVRVSSAPQIAQAQELFREYAAFYGGEDLAEEGFEEELETMPDSYESASGWVRIALADGEPAGCVAFHAIGDGRCEMKRLFVRPAFRNRGIARLLVEETILSARADGYALLSLDTRSDMLAAQALYLELGFERAGMRSQPGRLDMVDFELALGR